MSIKLGERAIIAAMNLNRVIGKEGGIPFPSDMRFFKDTTLNSVVIMGRKTWESLPFKLSQRANIVVASSNVFLARHQDEPDYVLPSLDKALIAAQIYYTDRPVFFIGGERIYKEALERGLCDKIYLSVSNSWEEGDVFFPVIPETFSVSHFKDVNPNLTRYTLVRNAKATPMVSQAA